ncbi:MAG: polyprenyl synthetase family protein [Blastomonas fulva]|jgi:farnesyl diphosphate synthase|nr:MULTISPECIES: farnesyl diphosphate synthase [Blastomonas]AOG01433.1 polyprenyl synthetase family protein [Blastomonas sp. RAC04]MCO5792412.1 polyprenyl synthetase family protein [Blastomonas sp.]MDK2758947.1 polyprenyl synthetase family protein [Blastomonas fulva]MDM7927338.1 polyprenyl synthetase family protein [Blastomonas fulva]MDM7964778.1 polyprenyl synthetase family protein [Blastomonas fulva]
MTTAIGDAALADAFRQISNDVDACFDALLVVPDDPRAVLYEAMRHAAIGGGKRVRPLLLTATAGMFNVDRSLSVRVACAVEAIHVYSLIHDDLPCMDDDDMRRGKPTVHKAFNDAVAVLAGDSLHALAFEILAGSQSHPDPFIRAELIMTLAEASGPNGMAGGQMMDLEAEKAKFDLPTVTKLQRLKTGALIAASVEMGAILANVPAEGRTALRAYARDIGLAFQIADDIMDEVGDEALAGKALHKDAAAGKETFLSLLGLERAREQAFFLVDQAIGHLASHGREADLLRALARYIVERDN